MNIQSLEYFLAVAECESFSAAAQKIYVTQPAVSHQIGSLEKELGVRLFERGSSSVKLTDAGAECLQIARSIVSECERLKMTAARFSGTVAGRFSVGYVNNRAGELSIPALREMSLVYPELKIDTRYIRVVPALEALKGKELDMIVTGEQSVKKYGWIEYQVLKKSGLVVVLPKDHSLASQRFVAFEQLRDEPLLLKKRDNFPEEYDAFLLECREHGFEPQRIQIERTTEDIFAQISLGRGIGCLGGGLLRSYVGDLKVLPLADSKKEHSAVAAWRKGEQTPAVREFLRHF